MSLITGAWGAGGKKRIHTGAPAGCPRSRKRGAPVGKLMGTRPVSLQVGSDARPALSLPAVASVHVPRAAPACLGGAAPAGLVLHEGDGGHRGSPHPELPGPRIERRSTGGLEPAHPRTGIRMRFPAIDGSYRR